MAERAALYFPTAASSPVSTWFRMSIFKQIRFRFPDIFKIHFDHFGGQNHRFFISQNGYLEV